MPGATPTAVFNIGMARRSQQGDHPHKRKKNPKNLEKWKYSLPTTEVNPCQMEKWGVVFNTIYTGGYVSYAISQGGYDYMDMEHNFLFLLTGKFFQ